MVKLAEEIMQLISDVLRAADWSSASPDFTNQVKNINPVTLPDLEETIQESKDSDAATLQKKKQKKVEKKVEGWDKGHVGQIQRMTTEQFDNIRSLAENPVTFIIQGVLRKFAKGPGVIALALIFYEVFRWLISEALQPGRFLDRRFRRDITNEILAFRSREEKQKLRQGRTSIIVTSIGGLRGGQGQVSSNLRAYAGLQAQPIPNNFSQPNTQAQASGQDLSFAKGKRRRFGR